MNVNPKGSIEVEYIFVYQIKQPPLCETAANTQQCRAYQYFQTDLGGRSTCKQTQTKHKVHNQALTITKQSTLYKTNTKGLITAHFC